MSGNPLSYSSLLKPDDSIQNAIKQLEELGKEYSSLLEKTKKDAIELEASIKKNKFRN